MTVWFGSYPICAPRALRYAHDSPSTHTYAGLPGTVTSSDTSRLDLICTSATSVPSLVWLVVAHACTMSVYTVFSWNQLGGALGQVSGLVRAPAASASNDFS